VRISRIFRDLGIFWELTWDFYKILVGNAVFFVISRLRLNVSLKDLFYGLIQADSAVRILG
jgi:hypothetical protein